MPDVPELLWWQGAVNGDQNEHQACDSGLPRLVGAWGSGGVTHVQALPVRLVVNEHEQGRVLVVNSCMPEQHSDRVWIAGRH